MKSTSSKLRTLIVALSEWLDARESKRRGFETTDHEAQAEEKLAQVVAVLLYEIDNEQHD